MGVTGYSRPPRRAGFTLSELLVVIAIIAVLWRLTAAAVMKAAGSGPRAQTRHEIGQFETGLTTAKQELGQVEYLPSRLVLCEDSRDWNPARADHKASMTILSKMFGKH